jgi:hypothetical protein
MGRLLIIAVFTGIFLLPVNGQSAEEDVLRLRHEMDTAAVSGTGINSFSTPASLPDRGHFGLSVGTGFSYMRGYGSGLSLYAAPTYSLALTPRLSAHAGLIASTYTGLNPGPAETGYGESPVFKSLAVFGAASYRMTERLTVHGAGVKYLLNYPTPPLMAVPPDHFTVGATYRLGDHIFIGASLHMNRANGYYPVSSFPGFYHPSPYEW